MGGSKSTLRTELYFQAAVVHDPREGAPSAAALYTSLWEKTNILNSFTERLHREADFLPESKQTSSKIH